MLPSLKGREHVLSENDIREQLSIAYVHAVASRAGFAWERTSIDRDGIDGRVMARGMLAEDATRRSPMLGWQLKATSSVEAGSAPIAFPLAQKNYEDLRGRCAEPRYLGLLVMPREPNAWLSLDAEALVLRRCMYWVSLTRAEANANTASTTVYLPRENVLDVDNMRRLMIAAAREEEV